MKVNEIFFAGFGVFIIIPEDVQRCFDFVPFPALNMIEMEQGESIVERLLIQSEGEYCNIWSEKKNIILCTCRVKECIVKIIELLSGVFAERTPYVLFHGSAVRGQKGNVVVFLGRNRVGKSTMLRHMVEERAALCISDDIVFLNSSTMEFESNPYLPILYRTENARGVYEEKYIIPSQDWTNRSRMREKKVVFIYLVCGEGEVKIEEIDGYEKVIILLASLWKKDREWISVICDLASKTEMYRCCFDELDKRIDAIYSLLGGKMDEENC